jgi:hypothetical protein
LPFMNALHAVNVRGQADTFSSAAQQLMETTDRAIQCQS